MAERILTVRPDDSSRLAEIGQLTSLAYLADGLIDNAHPYVPALRDARTRAKEAQLLAMADGEKGDGTIVGTITLVGPGSPLVEFAQGDEFELRMLAVSPLERGRGIGGSLTRSALDIAVQRGATRVVLSTMDSMHAAHRLYERMGFSRREDLDCVVLDNPDGSITRVSMADAPEAAVRLIGYDWTP